MTAIITIAAGPTSQSGEPALGARALGQMPAPLRRRGGGAGAVAGAGAHSSAAEDSDSLISLRSVLTTVLGLMLEVGESAFWIASVTSA